MLVLVGRPVFLVGDAVVGPDLACLDYAGAV
jgi:hypothetical protein